MFFTKTTNNTYYYCTYFSYGDGISYPIRNHDEVSESLLANLDNFELEIEA